MPSFATVAGCHKEVQMYVSQAKIQAFCREFPWLSKYLDELKAYVKWMKILRVQRLDLDVLEQMPYEHMYYYNNDYLKFFIIDKTGKVLHEVEQRHKMRVRPFNLFRPSTWFTKQVDGQKLKDALTLYPEFAYVLRINVELICPNIEIYKIPNNWNLADWLEELRRRETEILNKELLGTKWDGKTIKIWEEGTTYYVGFSLDSCAYGSTPEEALGKFIRNNAQLIGLDIQVQ